MTVSSSASTATFIGNGVTTAFAFTFNNGVPSGSVASTANWQLLYTDTSGNVTTVPSSQYSLTLTPPSAGQLWGYGGTVTYPLFGSPIAAGTTLTLSRIFPFTQSSSIAGQGNFSPQVLEAADDTLCMQIQQLLQRTGQFRGTWASGIVYNYGDTVIDGANGGGTGNYYMCIQANTSGTWTTDLSNGDWLLIIAANLGTASLPLAVGNGGTGSATASGARANLGLGTAAVENTGSVIGDDGAGHLTILTNVVGNSMLAQAPANTIKGNNTGGTANEKDLTVSQAQALLGIFPASHLTASLGANVSLTSTGAYFDGPSIAQGNTGTWWVSGTVTCIDTAGTAGFQAKLWDGTTVIASTEGLMDVNRPVSLSLSGYLSNPAGNLRISVKDTSSTSGAITYNTSGNSKDSTISAFRIA